MKKFFACLMGMFIGVACAQAFAPNGNFPAAPDTWLLQRAGPSWWSKTTPAKQPSELHQRAPTSSEHLVIDKARSLLVNRPAKAIALIDADDVVFADFKAPADANSLFYGYSMGKTVTSMAAGKAICLNKLSLDTKAVDLVPELKGKDLGTATVRDLLRMASGAADPNDSSSIWTDQQAKDWSNGKLTYLELLTLDRVATAKHGTFSDYKPGELFSYKATDPLLLSIMVARAAGANWSDWVQEQVLDPMGEASAGIYAQDKSNNGQADSGLHMTLDDWIRFGRWIKQSSKESGCFGDYVRAAISRQIRNPGDVKSRKFGGQFDGYGYFVWTDNLIARDTVWLVGYGGQRIGIDLKSDRMIVVFSNLESWMKDIYELGRDWMRASR
jgi:CubicO group peptidase (beta-lactamase class C family)